MRMCTKKRLALGLLAVLALTAGQAWAGIDYVIEISVDGLGGPYLEKMFDGETGTGTYSIPNFTKLKTEGAGTLYAHIDNSNYETLPNHASLITGRPKYSGNGLSGHNWGGNGEPSTTLHANNGGSYVAGVFDVAHDNGKRTGMYANKTKFSLFDNTGYGYGGGSYNATYGALDTTGADNGRRKLDNTYLNTDLGGTIASTYISHQNANPMHLAFLHFNNPDSAGHGSGWGSHNYYKSVEDVDAMLGSIFSMIAGNAAMTNHTAIVLTADHGYQGAPGANTYAVPFFVWAPGLGVTAGADLYTLNNGRRRVTDISPIYPMNTYAGMQPIRNAEASNLALDLLGLGPIPGSAFNYNQDLLVPEPATMALLAFGGLALLRRRRKA